MERSDFEHSLKRASQWKSRTRIAGTVTRDFMLITGRWRWYPERFKQQLYIWNPNGGPALDGAHIRTYWLCMGWSAIEVFPGDDPRDTLQNGGK
jgi:hypothetical protein